MAAKIFGDLNPLRSRPIPAPDPSRTQRENGRNRPIDQSHPAFGETLVEARDFGLTGRNHYAHDRNPPYWARAEGAIEALLVRQSVAQRLAGVNARLAPAGLRLFLFDAWRPRAVQAYFHDVWMPAEVRRRRPELNADAVAAEVKRYWAAPTADPSRPAPHETGGAVDISIVWDDGTPLFMGALFDDVTAIARTNWYEGDGFDGSYSAEEGRANRRLLYWLMIEAGFANHPDEWWHYSYGDQMWAAHRDEPAALYGLAAPVSRP